MRDRDAALDRAIREVAAILGNALVRLLYPESATFAATCADHPYCGYRKLRTA